jgi:RNA polymerase sigma-70 factor (ECF subfamily)
MHEFRFDPAAVHRGAVCIDGASRAGASCILPVGFARKESECSDPFAHQHEVSELMSDHDLTPDADWERLIDGLTRGDAQVLRAFYAEYGPMLRTIADSRLAPGMRRRFDADDVIQSTFRTFFRRAQVGYFQFEDNQRLWNLLCAITLTKLREKARFHQRQSRGVGREVATETADETGESGMEDASFVASGPTPDAAVEFADTFDNLVASLDEDERRLIDLKLQDQTNDEAAEALGLSERTVRRMLSRLQEKFEKLLRPDNA